MKNKKLLAMLVYAVVLAIGMSLLSVGSWPCTLDFGSVGLLLVYVGLIGFVIMLSKLLASVSKCKKMAVTLVRTIAVVGWIVVVGVLQCDRNRSFTGNMVLIAFMMCIAFCLMWQKRWEEA